MANFHILESSSTTRNIKIGTLAKKLVLGSIGYSWSMYQLHGICQDIERVLSFNQETCELRYSSRLINDKLVAIISWKIIGTLNISSFARVGVFILESLQQLNNPTVKNLLKLLYKMHNSRLILFYNRIEISINMGSQNSVSYFQKVTTHKLNMSYNLSYIYQYCPIIKLKVSKFENNTIIKTSDGCFIVYEIRNFSKLVYLKYNNTLNSIEFQIISSIIYFEYQKKKTDNFAIKDERARYREEPNIFLSIYFENADFISSALQCITNCQHIRQYFRTVNCIQGFEFNYDKYPFLWYLQHLFYTKNNNQIEYSKFLALTRILAKYEESYYEYVKNDPYEFLKYYLFNLNEELTNYYSISSMLQRNNHYGCYKENLDEIGRYSFIKKLFLVLTKTTIKCENCMHSKYKSTYLSTLSLKIPEICRVKINIKSIPFNFEKNQKICKLQALAPADLPVCALKKALSEKMFKSNTKAIMAIEIKKNNFANGLIAIANECEIIGNFAVSKTILYYFELPFNYNLNDLGYIFINHGIERNEKYEHIGYSLGIFPNIFKSDFKSFYNEIVINIQKVVNAPIFDNLNEIYEDRDISPKKKRKTLAGFSAYLYLESQQSSNINRRCRYYQEPMFKIYKLHFSDRPKLEILSIQHKVKSNKIPQILAGDNVLVKWDESFKRNSSFKFVINGIQNLELNLDQKLKSYLNVDDEDMSKNNLQRCSVTLAQCIQDYCQIRKISPQISKSFNWKCKQCNSLNAKEYNQIEELSPYLVIKLERFESISNSILRKNRKFVQFSTSLNFVYKHRLVKYNLISICNHIGTVNKGYYTVKCKNSYNKHWYHFNRDQVIKIQKSYLASSDTYFLIYQRKDKDIIPIKVKIDELENTVISLRLY
ncbi:cysteine proteinase [Conidiobolus coronatus NRRL 28638]|uniref:Cysteine proteinase n=1 Tax=Conidiobolus coronatus (strain ATCC 28846 / CBS 209.66 / NRRL 28638) TaxID=796925 RepID=A0A137NZ57_CONC2|nr:cysteine proteinase [Conidiobolus coronatus NRRL 28638]|eukprot:KXN68113.1 cysteine proteinase [Conidiobolus coronatus NRRL 28638]